MNDPCAPGYIPSTNKYHVGFQWNPNGAEWGDIVWGKAFSSDLVTWDVSEAPSLKRDAHYDSEGVFTGCWRPTGLDGKHKAGADGVGEVSFIYTSVSRLPIHYTKEYHRGCETLSLATSKDGGRTWVKHASNPILPGPPGDIAITGWRDPYVASWPGMRDLLSEQRPQQRGADAAEEAQEQEEQEPLFGIISGGIRHETPATFLYRVDPADLTKWTYLSPLTAPGLNFAPSRWTGDLGMNWEVTNFLTLSSPGNRHSQDFLIFGAEGCQPPHGGSGIVPGTKRCPRAQLWIAIDPAANHDGGEAESEHGALTEFSYGGAFDHGLYYAANGFYDPVTQQHVVIGWVTEDDIPVEMQANQGWSGCLSLPRVVSLTTVDNVVRATKSDLKSITNIKATPAPGQDGLFTVQTLGIAPDARLQKLRNGAARRTARPGVLLNPAQSQPTVHAQAQNLLGLQTAQWEARASFSSASSGQRTGLVIHHACTSQPTKLYFTPADETFVIERPDLHAPLSYRGDRENARLQTETAPFTLFTTRNVQTGAEVEERLVVNIFYDGSVLEVFVNNRAVITTRVYLEDARCSSLEFFSDGADVVLEEAVVWDGLSATA
jgi:beta-fructofuranosidase